MIRNINIEFRGGGTILRGRMFTPVVPGSKLPTFVVTGSWSSVKEQNPAAYAERLASDGYQVITFDHTGFGQSDGFPRNVEDPNLKVADVKAAADFALGLDSTDPDKLYGLGICAGGGYMVRAVGEDKRFKGLVTVAGWLTDKSSMQAFFGENFALLQEMGDGALAKFNETGEVDYLLAAGPEGAPAAMAMDAANDYYVLKHSHGAWLNRFAKQSFASITRFDSISSAVEQSVPTVMVHADNALLPESIKAYFAAIPHNNKQLIWQGSAQQIEFYYVPELVESSAKAVSEFFARKAA